ncbi:MULTISPECIES: hypothetical protein [Bacillales]|uniref:hypothetical protein n=1 Tax=Bacillales TaxID=1385 RepID=UPI0006A78C99|nr:MULTISPECIES: hypothetical protein [Bacillales]OBZ16496.1 hypothetical protein A7975_00780 [Bacillus sp. FJAT-26390]
MNKMKSFWKSHFWRTQGIAAPYLIFIFLFFLAGINLQADSELGIIGLLLFIAVATALTASFSNKRWDTILFAIFNYVVDSIIFYYIVLNDNYFIDSGLTLIFFLLFPITCLILLVGSAIGLLIGDLNEETEGQ